MSSSDIIKLKSYAGLINDILNDNQITINTISSGSTTGPAITDFFIEMEGFAVGAVMSHNCFTS